MLETLSNTSVAPPTPAIIRGVQLDFNTDLSKVRPLAVEDDGFDEKSLSCSYFSMKNKAGLPNLSVEVRKIIDSSFFLLGVVFANCKIFADVI